jgi:hypothetical protein
MDKAFFCHHLKAASPHQCIYTASAVCMCENYSILAKLEDKKTYKSDKKGKLSIFTIFVLLCNGEVPYMLLFNPIFLILLFNKISVPKLDRANIRDSAGFKY